MNTLLALVVYIVALIAAVSVFQLTVLAFRNPFRPTWLNKAGAESIAATANVGSLSVSTAFEIAGLIAAGFNAFFALAITMALIFGVVIFNWHIFRYGERLRRADAGHSPFEPLTIVQGPHGVPATSN